MTSARATTPSDLLEDFSLEMTAKDLPKLQDALTDVPARTHVNVTYLGNEGDAERVEAARAVREFGLVPVPHIAARRLQSETHLKDFLSELQSVGASEHVFVVGGDPSAPEGPFQDTLSVLRSGLLQEHGVRQVSVSGYPEGHPGISDPVLWEAIESKHALLRKQGLLGTVITQFGFDAEGVLAYLQALRARGMHLPVRVGVPGPAGVKRLMGYASRFGVGTSTSIARKYGLSLTNLLSTAGPDRFLHALADGYTPVCHGELKVHFYTFGGLQATAEWIADFRARS